jgi:uncharacterized phage protein (TIGR02218 family)
MKPAVADYRYKVHCVRIVPLWGPAVYLTDHVRDLTMNGHTYLTQSGYQFTGQTSEHNMSPGVMDLSGIADIAGIDYNEIVSGVFDNARVYCFATTWRSPVEDEEPLGMAFMGKITLRDKRYTAELMMAIDVLNQSIGKTYTPSCQKKFGGQEYAGCMVDLAPITVTGTITDVTSNSVFRDSARTEDDDYFGEGTIAFTTGANAGLKPQEIKTYVGQVDAAIEDISNAASALVTSAGHSFVTGDVVEFSGVVGMTEINGLSGTVAGYDADTFTVNINTTAFSSYVSSGLASKLKGGITTHEAFHYPVEVGDEYTMIPGCRKRLRDCRDKWNNIVNFGGFSFIPTSSQYQDRGLK